MFNAMGVPEGEQIEHKMLSNAIEKAQKKIETNNYGIRRNLLEYDQVMNEQREIIYGERMKVLNGESMRSSIIKMTTDFVEKAVDLNISGEHNQEEWDYKSLNEMLLPVIPIEPVKSDASVKTIDELKHVLKERAIKLYESKEAEFPEAEQLRELERVILLRVIDARDRKSTRLNSSH